MLAGQAVTLGEQVASLPVVVEQCEGLGREHAFDPVWEQETESGDSGLGEPFSRVGQSRGIDLPQVPPSRIDRVVNPHRARPFGSIVLRCPATTMELGFRSITI
ncbi:hypothetical protein ABZ412_19985 [Nocardia sp. NPDC005746]|uniref:hypothetical protein n=1 Tax=Nocardia sp. NPDC005746 TaxID=3157062 RepID=UPI0033E05BC0